MAWEPIRVIPITMGAAATLTSYVDLKSYYRKISLVMPTMASASDFYITVAETSSDLFRRVKIPANNTATVAVNTFPIASGVSNAIIPLPIAGVRYLKIEASTANSNAIGFKLICGG